MKLMKLARKRDNTYPQGVSAPLHCDCPCGGTIAIAGDAKEHACPNCGLTVDNGGWVIKEGKSNA